MIDQQTIDRILNTAQIQEVVGDYVTLRRRGVNLIGLCPFHDEKTPSFIVSPAKGICKCFGCGKGGNSVNFIMELEQLNYYEALKHLAKKYNIEVVEKELSAEQMAQRNDRESMFVVNEYARTYFANILHEHIDGKAVGMSYFRERGFTEETIRKFQLGYSLDGRDSFTKDALNAGYQKEFLIKTGLTTENEAKQVSDRFRGRVMFPVHTISGKVVAFGGRILKKIDNIAKYVNSPESEIYHKSNELYGIYFAKQAIVKHDRCFMVEGYTDVISMHQAGIENVVSSSGTSLTHGQIRLIHRLTSNVTVIYDGDAAGIKASLRGIDMLLEEGMNIKVVSLPEGEDPDSFAQKQNASDFIAYVEKHSIDFIRFKTNLLLADAGNDPIKRAALITDIVRSIAVIPDNIIRSVYAKECSSLMKIDEQVLHNEINNIKREKLEKEAERPQDRNSFNNNLPPQAPEPEDYMPMAPMEEDYVAAPAVNHYKAEELHILRYIVRYGEQHLFDVEVDTEQGPSTIPLSVTAYICHELNTDGLMFTDPIHALMLAEAEQHIGEENFKAERYFLNNPHPAISRLALDLATDKYILSKSQEEQIEKEDTRLKDIVPRAVFEFKNKFLLLMMKEKMDEMKIAHEQQDIARVEELMMEISKLNEVKAELSKTLGERIIIRL